MSFARGSRAALGRRQHDLTRAPAELNPHSTQSSKAVAQRRRRAPPSREPIAVAAVRARSDPRPTRSPMRWRGCPRPMPLSKPECAVRDEAGLRADKPARCRRWSRAPQAGPRPKPFPRCDFALIDANAALRTLALDLARTSARFATSPTSGARLSPLLPRRPADLVVASYVIGELGEAERGSSPN